MSLEGVSSKTTLVYEDSRHLKKNEESRSGFLGPWEQTAHERAVILMITFVVVKDGMLSSLKAFVISYSSNNVGIPCIFHCFLFCLCYFFFFVLVSIT